MSGKMKNLLIRALTGIVFLAVVIGGIIYGAESFIVVFAIITGLMIWEFCSNINACQDAGVNRLISTVAGVYLFFAFFGFCSNLTPSAVFIPYILSLIYLLISELYLHQDDPVKNWAYAFAAQVYIALPMALLNVLAFRPQYEWVFPLSVFIFLWANDTGAYLFGSMLGRKLPAKLFPRISPKKTWVGSIGGGLVCLGAGAVLWYFFPNVFPIWHWLGIAATVCVFGTWGDLVESQYKRTLGIKDSGDLLPGHGGVLDRFDSSLIAIPAVVLYLYTLNAVRMYFQTA